MKFPSNKLVEQVGKNQFVAEANNNMVVADFTDSTMPICQSQESRDEYSNVRRKRSVVTKPRMLNPYAEPFEARVRVQFDPKNLSASKAMSK